MAEKKFSELTAKGATIADTDLVAISESAGGGTYVSKSVTGANVKALVTDANLVTSDITTNNVSTSKHGFVPKAPNDATQFLDGTGAFDTVKDSDLSLSDITTNDVSTTKHGFVPKAPNNTTTFLRGDGTWATPASGGLTEFTEAETIAAPNATVAVNSLTPVAGTTNADFAIVPKGTGAILAAIPDNTATGGNKRGVGAVDLQTSRTFNDRVASGANSVVIGGSDSRSTQSCAISGGAAGWAQGTNSTAFQGGVTSADRAFAHGLNTASGVGSTALGGSFAYGYATASGTASFAAHNGTASGEGSFAFGEAVTASGTDSCAFGFGTINKGIHSSFVMGSRHTTQGDCQKLNVFISARTTNNTATTLTVRNIAVGATSQLVLSNNTAVRFKGTIIGKQSGSANTSAWDIDGLIVRTTSAANTTLVVSNVNVVSNTPAWGTPTLAADTTNGGLTVQVIGAAATNIQWACALETTETLYA